MDIVFSKNTQNIEYSLESGNIYVVGNQLLKAYLYLRVFIHNFISNCK